MKKVISSYVSGSFVDYRGKEHKVIVCGITAKPSFVGFGYPDVYANIENSAFRIEKTLNIGFAICNPNDSFDEAKGEKIAASRAESAEAIIMSTSKSGMFNTNTVNAILNDYLDYIIKDPGSVIKGYDAAKEKYVKNQKLVEEISSMTDKEIEVAQILACADQESIDRAKKIVKLLQN